MQSAKDGKLQSADCTFPEIFLLKDLLKVIFYLQILDLNIIMVRNYQKKTNRGNTYTEETVNLAISEIKRGALSIRRASRMYNVPFSTIQSYMSARRKVKSQTGGRPTALPPEEEARLANFLKVLEKWGFGLSRIEVLDCVEKFVVENKIKTPFKNNRPGEDWFLYFKKRHNLSIKKPQSVEYSRKKMTDPFVINEYFNLLHQQLTELDLFDKPCRIWNLDETSVCTDPSKTKIVGQKGKSCSRTTGGSGKENITCLAAASASGKKAPPLIIFKGVNVWSSWIPDLEKEEESYPGMAYAASANGWITSDIFYNYLEKTLIPALDPERPVLLLYDGHSTHVTNKVVQLANDNDITILKLPPHTSHLLQPLDLAVFKSLKVKWDQKLCIWQRKHTGARVPKKEFTILFGETWKQLDPEIIINGFKKGGICPFDRFVVPKEKFDPQAWSRWEAFETNRQAPVRNNDEEGNGANRNNIEKTNNVEEAGQENEQTENGVARVDEEQNDGKGNSQVEITSQNKRLSTTVSFESLLLNTVKTERSNSLKTTRKRVAPGAEVITASQVRDKLILPKAKKTKISGKKKTKKRSESDSDSDLSTTIEPEYIDTDDDMDPENLSDVENEEEEILPDLEFKVGQYVVVEFCTKKAKKSYIGKILKIDASSLYPFYCSFLKAVTRLNFPKYYVFPDTEDTSWVDRLQILKVLAPPDEKRGHFYFTEF